MASKVKEGSSVINTPGGGDRIGMIPVGELLRVAAEGITIRTLILMSMVFAFTACQQSGYLKAGVWPSHNEDILNPHQDINKYRLEVSELITFRKVSLEVNPVFIFGGAWPKYTESYGYDWINCQCNFIVRAYATKNINVYYHKRLFIDIVNKTGDYCNCTYSNEVGVQVTW